MPELRFQTLVAALFALPLHGAIAAGPVQVLYNATVYTADAEQRVAGAIAFDADGIIRAVGDSGALRARFGDGIDLGGATVLPGFHDVHLHAVEAGVNSVFCALPQFGGATRYRRALRACAADWAADDWVIAAGVNMAALLRTVDDPRALADAVVADKPLLVIDDLGHGAWANTRALEVVGFDRIADSPPGGLVLRNARGRPNGVVLESAAQTLIDAALPQADWLETTTELFAEALAELARNGITTVSDAGGYWPRGHHRVWQRTEAAGDLTVRASNALYLYPDRDPDAQIARLRQLKTDGESALHRFDQVKIYVDGILSQTTGRVATPYAVDLGLSVPGASGFDYFDTVVLQRYARELSALGFSLHFHATGELGVRAALDAAAQAAPASGPHRITHVYRVHPNDRDRFAELGVFADFQIAPSTQSGSYQRYIASLLGVRAPDLMPLNALHAAGAPITISSDWDADTLSPLVKLATVFTQHPTLSRADVLDMMTTNGAALLRQGATTGSLEVGKRADIAIVDGDVLNARPGAIAAFDIVATVLGGRVVYHRDPEWPFPDAASWHPRVQVGD
ncbi:MAG: amidohydrolase family protein [Pseudomonadota bacterium]